MAKPTCSVDYFSLQRYTCDCIGVSVHVCIYIAGKMFFGDALGLYIYILYAPKNKLVDIFFIIFN